MNTKQKFSYMLFGAVIGIAGLAVGLCVSPLTAQKEVFGEITCTKLTVVSPDGRKTIVLTVDEDGGGRHRAWQGRTIRGDVCK